MPTHGGTTQSFGWSADAARPVVRRGASEQTQSTWIEECGDDLDGPIRPPPPIVASSTRPKNLGMQRPAFVERAQEEGYAGYHGEAVGGTVSELIHGAASSPPPPPQLGAASPGTPRSRLSAPAWAERMHGRPSALAGPDGDGAGAAQRGGERSYSFVRTDVPDDPHERALRREAAAVRAIEMYSGRGAPAGGARAAAHAQLASPSASPGSARALVRGASEGSGAGSPRRALQPYAPAVSPGHGASDGPFALAAALAHARIPDMRRGIAVPTSRMVLSREPDPAWSARRPLDSFADLGDGLAASEPAGSYDPLPRRARSPGKAESAIRVSGRATNHSSSGRPMRGARRRGGAGADRCAPTRLPLVRPQNLGAIEPPPPVHSPSRRGGGSSAQRQRNGSAAIAGALHDASDLAQQWAAALHGALPADPAQVPPISPRRAPTERRGRATTPPRDERQSVAYALGIDGHSLRQAASQPPPPPAWSPARASKTSYEPGEMFALLQQDEYPPTLRARSPRAGSEHWRSPRAGRETGGIPVSPRARAWR